MTRDFARIGSLSKARNAASRCGWVQNSRSRFVGTVGRSGVTDTRNSSAMAGLFVGLGQSLRYWVSCVWNA